MFDSTDLRQFIEKLRSHIGNLDELESICQAAKRSPNPFIKIIATSVLHICKESQAYLAFFGAEVEKSFFGICIADEETRVSDNVFTPFKNKLDALYSANDDSGQFAPDVLDVVADLVDSWDRFPKENLREIITSEHPKNE